jgi:FMN phosphatase YigB (HAD superfamily)
MIDLYVFDEGGVMIRGHMVMQNVAEEMGIAGAVLRSLLPPDIYALQRGEIDSAEFWNRFAARTGVAPERNWLEVCFRPRRDEPTFALARELAAGARVVCGTNTIDCHHETNEALGMYDCFHAVYASHLMHRMKPEPGFWLDILQAEGATAERTFFTDDSAENVVAARALGIRSFLYSDAEGLRRDLLSVGAPIAASAPVVRATDGPIPRR